MYLGITTCSLLAGKQPIRISVRRLSSRYFRRLTSNMEFAREPRKPDSSFGLASCGVVDCRVSSSSISVTTAISLWIFETNYDVS